MDNQYNSIPVTFERIQNYDINDTRFTKVKIKVLHTGLNYNNSIFEKNVVNNRLNTMLNCPIVAYVEKDGDGAKDYSDHHEVIVKCKNKNEFKSIYKGMPYGVIPENTNMEWVTYQCDDGVEREFLEVEGLIWNKLEDSSILLEATEKGQSMELFPDSIRGHFDKDNHFVFDDFIFEAFCMLGDNVTPAMIGATVSTNFTVNVDEIKTKLKQFNAYFSKSQTQISDDIKNNENMEGGQNKLTTELIDSIFAEFEVDKSTVDFEINDNTTEESLREFLTNFTQQQKQEGESQNVQTVFSTYNEKREALRKALPNKEIRSENNELEYAISYWVSDMDDNFVYVEQEEYKDDNWNSTKGRFSYSENDGLYTINGEFEPMIVKWITESENNEIEKARTEFEVAKSEFNTQIEEFERLKKFEKDTLEKEFNVKAKEIFTKFDEKLNGVAEYDVLKTSFSTMSIDAIEDKCYSLLGRQNADFSVNNNTNNGINIVNIGVSHVDNDLPEDDGYGGLLSKKYNN